MKRTNYWLGVLGLIALTAFAQSAWAACTSNASGDWKDPIWTASPPDTNATCNTNSGPSAGSTVIIANGTNVKVDATTFIVANVTINAGGTLRGTNGNTLSLSGNFTNNGTFTANGGTVAFTGTAPTITGNVTFANLTLAPSTVLNLAGNVTVTGTLTGTFTLKDTCPTNYTVTITTTGAVTNSCPATAGGGGGGGGGQNNCIPTTINGVPTPVMAQAGQLDTRGSTVNGGGGALPITGTGNTVPAPTGVTVAATPILPPLTPATMPVNPANQVAPANNIPPGNYDVITTNTPTTFTGGAGAVYNINTLTANGPITLGTGTYYIDQLNLNANLTVTGVVQIFIGTGFDVRANNVSVNAGGSVANLQVNFYPNAQLDTHGSSNFSFTGLMYAPYASTQIQIDGTGSTLTGAVISGGQVQLNNTTILYGPTQQAQVATMTTTCSGGGGGATASSFNAFESSTAANATTGLLYTKLAGTAFAFDVVAIQTNGTAIANTFAGTVKVELVDASTGAACAAAPLVQSVGTITFATANAGRMTAPSTTVAAAWSNVRVRMTAPATGTATTVACSTDNFAIRPSSFTVTASAVPALGATIKVGSNFNLTATSNVSSGYTGTPAVVPASVFVDGTTTPITATNLVGAFAAATGAAATGTFQYNELGTITLNTDAVLDTTFTSLDQASGGCVSNSASNVLSGGKYGCNIGSAVFGPLGRFIPDHFDTVVTQGCNTTGTAVQIFTYSGQPFTATITARGAATATPTDKQMTKYAGTYAKNTAFAVPANGAFSVLQALNTDFVSGVATKTLVFVFTTLPSVPAPITIRATDTDGVTSLGATEGAVNARVGRFNVANAVGADLYPLSVPWAVQYYNTNGWITNSDDTCTIAPATSAIGLSNYKGGLSSTSVTAVTLLTAVPATASNGAGIITLAKPSPKLARSGSVWVSPPTLPSWLQPGVAGLATFSIFNGAKEFIYMRENY